MYEKKALPLHSEIMNKNNNFLNTYNYEELYDDSSGNGSSNGSSS